MTKNEIFKIRKMTDRQFLYYFSKKVRSIKNPINWRGQIHDARLCVRCKWQHHCSRVCKVWKFCKMCGKVKLTIEMCSDSVSRTSAYGICKDCRLAVSSYFCINNKRGFKRRI